MARPSDNQLPAEVVRVGRPNDVSGEPLFTAADLRAARRDQSDLDRQIGAAETKSDARLD